MLRYDPRSGNLAATELGRVASHFYLRHESIEAFNDKLKPALVPHIDDAGALSILCSATEFEELRVRPEELAELDRLKAIAPLKLIAPVEDPSGKAAVLLQAYISQHKCSAFTLISDCNYAVRKTALVHARARCSRLRCATAGPRARSGMLALTKAIDNRVWWFQTPLRQLDMRPPLPPDALRNLEEKKSTIEQILDMLSRERASLGDPARAPHTHNPRYARRAQAPRKSATFVTTFARAAACWRRRACYPISNSTRRYSPSLSLSRHSLSLFDWAERYLGSLSLSRSRLSPRGEGDTRARLTTVSQTKRRTWIEDPRARES